MKKSNFLVKGLGALAFMAALASCASKASVEGTIAGASDAQVVVKLLDVNRYTVLDTIKTDAKGKFAYSIEVEEGMPEFVYLFYKNNIRGAYQSRFRDRSVEKGS
jgi:predicted transcriptional regulator